jgi:ABC-2 type transport system ATP-binding protein
VEHVAKVMEMTSVANVKDRLLKNLSKGYRQRTGVAQALIGFPPVLILDEPTAGLDPAQIAGMRNLLRGLAGKHTIILSSHILSEVSEVCEQIVIISGGRVAANQNVKDMEKGGGVLLLTVKTDDPERALDCVRAVKGVVQVSSEGEQIRLSITGGDETRVALFRALVVADLPILEMSSESAFGRQSLERAFLNATAGGRA